MKATMGSALSGSRSEGRHVFGVSAHPNALTDVRWDARAMGQSPAWRHVLTRARKVAATEATACLQGESGTGKEVVARLIHNWSPATTV
jgi:DNA-binding NtrC family response regulator